MSYLLDTNVISELVTPKPDPRVTDWFDKTDEDELFISVIAIAEIRHGIEMMAVGKRRALLNAWSTNDLPIRFEGRILSVDTAIAAVWGFLSAHRKAMGRVISTMDCFIAATAKRHNLTLVTRNIVDFEALELTLFNPWQDYI